MYPNIELEMFRQKISAKQLADACGISESTMRNKLKGRNDFKMAEAIRLMDILHSSCEYLFAREDELQKDRDTA